jgi:hypothetical protein
MSVIAQSWMCGAVPCQAIGPMIIYREQCQWGCLAWHFQAICGPTTGGNFT